MGWSARSITDEFTIESPDGDKATVIIHKFDNGQAWAHQRRAEETKLVSDAGAVIRDDIIEAVVSWTVTGDDGEPLPVTHKTLNIMPPEVVNGIHEKIRDLNPHVWEKPADPTEASPVVESTATN